MNPGQAKTMWQRVDEVCKRDEEPYMECTGKGMTPALPVGADRVECEKRRCWSICKDGKFELHVKSELINLLRAFTRISSKIQMCCDRFQGPKMGLAYTVVSHMHCIL